MSRSTSQRGQDNEGKVVFSPESQENGSKGWYTYPLRRHDLPEFDGVVPMFVVDSRSNGRLCYIRLNGGHLLFPSECRLCTSHYININAVNICKVFKPFYIKY